MKGIVYGEEAEKQVRSNTQAIVGNFASRLVESNILFPEGDWEEWSIQLRPSAAAGEMAVACALGGP